jgi:hypothetical protein
VVKDFLDFYCTSESVGLSVISEFILFLSGEKEIIRLSLNNQEFKIAQKLCIKHNLYFEYTSFETKDFGEGWTSLIKNYDKIIENKNNTIVIVIGKTAHILYEYISAEANFDFAKAGELLGYPKCCIKSYVEIEELKNNWYQYYFTNDRMKYPLWANRINTIFGGGSFIGEMFPCSLYCKKAIEIGQRAASTMDSYGLTKLSGIIKSHCLAPIYIDDSNKISKIITPHKIEFY